eukprot:84223_1
MAETVTRARIKLLNSTQHNIVEEYVKGNHLSQYKGYDDRLIACNGDCGSSFSVIVDHFVHQKGMDTLYAKIDVDTVIGELFWIHGSPLRSHLAHLLYEKQIIDTKDFYKKIYNQLTDVNCYITGKEWIHKIKDLLLMLSVDDHMDIIEDIANFTCRIPNRSLLEEVNAFRNRRNIELQQQINIIENMLSAENVNDITVRNALLKQKHKMVNSINNKVKINMNLADYRHKINELKQCEEYQIMRQNNLELSQLELLSVILYCDYNVFASKMRESQRVEKMNSCEWRKLFYYLHCAITKMHKVFCYQNKDFRREYIKKKFEQKLFRGVHGISFNFKDNQKVPLRTVTSFTEEFGIATDFTYGNGFVLAIDNAFKSIYYGHLKAANVAWISKFREREWIVLPVTFDCLKEITPDDIDFLQYSNRDLKSVRMYKMSIIDSKCDIYKCKSLKRILITLSDGDVSVDIDGRYQWLQDDFDHISEKHRNEISQKHLITILKTHGIVDGQDMYMRKINEYLCVERKYCSVQQNKKGITFKVFIFRIIISICSIVTVSFTIAINNFEVSQVVIDVPKLTSYQEDLNASTETENIKKNTKREGNKNKKRIKDHLRKYNVKQKKLFRKLPGKFIKKNTKHQAKKIGNKKKEVKEKDKQENEKLATNSNEFPNQCYINEDSTYMYIPSGDHTSLRSTYPISDISFEIAKEKCGNEFECLYDVVGTSVVQIENTTLELIEFTQDIDLFNIYNENTLYQYMDILVFMVILSYLVIIHKISTLMKFSSSRNLKHVLGDSEVYKDRQTEKLNELDDIFSDIVI